MRPGMHPNALGDGTVTTVSHACFFEIHPSCEIVWCECYCHRPEDPRGRTFDEVVD